MSKTNRPLYAKKINSSRLKEFGYSINNTFDEFMEFKEIIALSDNQMLRTIRDVTKRTISEDNIEYLINLKSFYSKMAKKESKRKAKIVSKLSKYKQSSILEKYLKNESIEQQLKIQDKIYRTCYIDEFVVVVIDEKSHYDYMYKNGFYINGNRYERLSCSAGQARVSTVVFCKSDIIEEVELRLNNGRNMDKKFSPSKFNAYFGLSSSATKIVTEPKFIVIKDYHNTTSFMANYVIENGWKVDDTIKQKELKDVDMNRTDGMGLISPKLAKIWANDLGLDYIPSQFCIRQNFIKGMVCVFPIHQFCEEVNNGNYEIDTIYKDSFGNTIKADIREYDLILTESQFKLWDSFDSIEQYISNCKKNNLKWGVALTNAKSPNKILKLNYQFIQTLSLKQKDIEKLADSFVDWISRVSYKDRYYMLLFLLGVNNTEDKIKSFLKSSQDYWIKALILNDNIKNDKYIRGKIRKLIKNKIECGCKGDIYVEGNFQPLVSDPYGFMQHVCGLEVSGLLKNNESYSNYWNNENVKEVDAMRSPLTYLSEHVILNLVKNKETEKWYKYCNTGIILSYHGHETFNFAGADFDMDILATTSNKIMISGVYKNELPVVYDAPTPKKIIFTKDDLYESDKFSFGSIIGSITNKSSNGYSLLPIIESEYGVDSQEYKLLKSRLQQCCKAQSAQIDKAKIGRDVKGIPKVWTNKVKYTKKSRRIKRKELYNSILLNKYPYFFKYIYSETKKKYNSYVDEYDKTCRQRYGLGMDDLKKSKRMTVEQIEYIEEFNKYCPVLNSDSPMNLLCRYIEGINFNISEHTKIETKEDVYGLYKTKEIEYDSFYPIVSEKLKSLLKDIRQTKVIDMSIDEYMPNNFYKKDDSFRNIFKSLTNICPNVDIVVNCLVDYYYIYNPKANKDVLWKMVGKYIVENIKENTESKSILFPFPTDATSDIKYMGYNYELREVKI